MLRLPIYSFVCRMKLLIIPPSILLTTSMWSKSPYFCPPTVKPDNNFPLHVCSRWLRGKIEPLHIHPPAKMKINDPKASKQERFGEVTIYRPRSTKGAGTDEGILYTYVRTSEAKKSYAI